MSSQSLSFSRELLSFIDQSPSPWHAVSCCETLLLDAGFQALDEKERWQIQSGGKYFVIRGESSIIAFIAGQQPMLEQGLRIVGAHTDSPGLRIKPKPTEAVQGMVRLGVEVYGGPILATFADRDLSLAGRVVIKNKDQNESRLIHFDKTLLRLPNLAIHMNPEVNKSGLKFNRQTELPLIFGIDTQDIAAEQRFRQLLATELQIESDTILGWELNACDTQPGSIWGDEHQFIANSQLDNLASCHAAISALLESEQADASCICAFFDHEEVGSESHTGAGGSFLADVIQRLGVGAGLDVEDLQRVLAKSFFISADMAHAWHPNFPGAYEPGHHVLVNQGPVIKHNVNQRYTSNADTAARFMRFCETAGVPFQQYVHHSDLGCGSTIGPTLAAQLGIASVDVGSPMWAMHSIRESAGVEDHWYMYQALTAAFAS